MRTITNTFNVYSFKELSDEAKENAIDRVRYDRNCLSWQDEAINSIEEISKAMNCKAEWYSYDGIKYYVSFTSNEYEDIETLEGKRAYAYIVNNYLMPNKEKIGKENLICFIVGTIALLLDILWIVVLLKHGKNGKRILINIAQLGILLSLSQIILRKIGQKIMSISRRTNILLK